MIFRFRQIFFIFVWIVGSILGDAIFWASVACGLLLFSQGPNRKIIIGLLIGAIATELFLGLTVGPLMIATLCGSFFVQLIRRMFLFPQWTVSERHYFLFDLIFGVLLGMVVYVIASFVRTIIIS